MPFQYSFDEKLEMLLIYGECRRNATLAAETYAERFPNNNHPNKQIFKKLCQSLRERGDFRQKVKVFQNYNATNELAQGRVLNLVANDPNLSCREISAQTNISKTSVSRILKRHHFHPYHIELHQQLYDRDFENRVTFCQWAQNMIVADPNFFDKVLFTDESCFKSNGLVNRHNMHYWAVENPHWMREQDYQNRWSLNVWGGIINNRIVGPFFFDGHLNGETYASFLRNHLNELLDEVVPLNQRDNIWFQQDGAPPHFSVQAREELQQQFGNSWISRGGPVHWPARSPDLTPPDFFLWGTIKQYVYAERPTTRENMMERITDAFRRFNRLNSAATVQVNFRRRLQLCIEQNGRIFEHLL